MSLGFLVSFQSNNISSSFSSLGGVGVRYDPNYYVNVSMILILDGCLPNGDNI